jgi:protein SCO1/2
MKLFRFLVIGILMLNAGCKNAEENSAVNETRENLSGQELPDLSIYHLPSTWTTQNNDKIQLEELRGDVLVMVMIYTSCQVACPRLVADMRNIREKVSAENNKGVKYVFVSIDPEVDTPERLKAFAKENKMDNDQWLFLRGTPEDTREFAAVLAVNYKRISPMDFSHSNIISVFDRNGVLVQQKEGLGVDDKNTIAAIEKYSK